MSGPLFAMTWFRVRKAMGSMKANCAANIEMGSTIGKTGTLRSRGAVGRRRRASRKTISPVSGPTAKAWQK